MFGTSRIVSLVLAFCLGFSVCAGVLAFGTMAAVSKFRVRDIEKYGIDLPDESFMGPNYVVDPLNLSLVDFYNEILTLQGMGDDLTVNTLRDRYDLKIHPTIESVLTDETRTMPLSKLFSSEGVGKILGGVYIGNIEKYTCHNADGTEAKDPKAEGSYWMTADGTKITGIEDIIADFSLNDFLSGGINTDVLFDEVTIGDVLGYTHDGEIWYDKDGNEADGLIGAFAGSTIHGIGDDINDLQVGKILGYTYDESSDCWYKTVTNDEGVEEREDVEGVLAFFAGSKINEIGGDIEGASLGELLGYKLSETDGLWYKTVKDENGNKTDEEVTGVMAFFANSNINNISKDIEGASLGELLGYKLNEKDGLWYKTVKDGEGNKTDEEVTGVMAFFANSNINNISEDIEGASLGELLGYKLNETDGLWYKTVTDEGGNKTDEEVTGPMAVFANSTINNVGDEIENSKIGELLGYKLHDDGLWYKTELDEDGNKKEVEVDGFMSKLAGSKINETDQVFNKLVISDVVKERTGIFSIIPADTNVNNIGSEVNNSIMKSPIQFFINQELISFKVKSNDGTESDMADTLDEKSEFIGDYTNIYPTDEEFATKESYYQGVWEPVTGADGNVEYYTIETWRTQELSTSFGYIISLLTTF